MPDQEDERTALTREILNTDRRIYQAIQAGSADEWLRPELTMRQLKVLLILHTNEPQSVRMGGLAAALRVTLPTVTGIVDRLVDQRFVLRMEDPADRRLVVARLTAEGHALVDRLHDNGRRHLAETLGKLGVEDLRVVARALDLLLNAALGEGSSGTGSGPAEPPAGC